MWQHRKLTNIKIFRGTKQKFMSPLRSTSLRNDLAEAVSNAMNTNGLSWNDLAIGKGKKEQIIIRCISTGCKKSISPIQNKNLFFFKGPYQSEQDLVLFGSMRLDWQPCNHKQHIFLPLASAAFLRPFSEDERPLWMNWPPLDLI